MKEIDEGAVSEGILRGASQLAGIDNWWLPEITSVSKGYVREILAQLEGKDSLPRGFQTLASEIVVMMVAAGIADQLAGMIPDHDASNFGNVELGDTFSSAESVVRRVWLSTERALRKTQ